MSISGKRFGIIGVGGYIAPRHLKAIKETGNELVVAMDINDSVGIMDSYFPEAEFFTEFEQFETFIEDEKQRGYKLDYMTICSPNYLHLPHIKFALRNGIDVICEKPLVLNSTDLNILKRYEKIYNARVNSILQLRMHPSITALREMVKSAPKDKIFEVDLTYMTSRGKWYKRSWKGFENKSGGVATNIGIHFYDMLHYIFGDLYENEVYYRSEKSCSGYLQYQRANVKWFLSIDAKHLPKNAVKGEKLTYRVITIEDEELEFSEGFTNLHTQSYKHILAGKGYGIDENSCAIQTVEGIKNSKIIQKPNNPHKLLAKVL